MFVIVAYPEYIREKARQMRSEKRMTLDEIAERLAISKSTVWYWIRDIEVGRIPRGEQTPGRIAVRECAARSQSRAAAAKRELAYENGRAEYERLSGVGPFRDFVALYIGEGTRSDRNCVALANSNPAVIRIAAYFIRRFATNPVGYFFQYHPDQNPEVLRAYWSDELRVPPAEIKAYPKSNSGGLAGRNRRSQWGVLTVRTSDTALRARIQAWMDEMQAEWALHSGGFGV